MKCLNSLKPYNNMKNIFIFLLCLTVLTNCKNDSEKKEEILGVEGPEKTAKQSDGLTLLVGDFIYYADAAVLQTHNEVYGVVINDKMHEIAKQAKSYQKETTDMVRIQVRGKIIPKPEGEEGWPFKVDIKEVLKVNKLDPKQNEVIKIGQ